MPNRNGAAEKSPAHHVELVHCATVLLSSASCASVSLVVVHPVSVVVSRVRAPGRVRGWPQQLGRLLALLLALLLPPRTSSDPMLLPSL